MLLIKNGRVLDPASKTDAALDVLLDGEKIAKVGANLAAPDAEIFDAKGLVVAPGFINIHSHATPDGLQRAENMLTQGVTTEIVNADGSGPIDIGDQLDRAAARGLAVNLGAQIGFNSIWSQVIGPADRRATPQDIERMRALIVDGLTSGAWGVSAGLDYKPAYFAQGEEVIKVVEAAKSFRTIFINHDRVTPESGFSSRAGMEETIAIGERAGLAPVITHMKVQGHEQGSADQILSKMREATGRGAYTAADAYPYLAGQTGLVALIIPGWAQDGGREAMLRRFADPELRARIVRDAEEAMDKRFGGAAGIYLPATKQQLTAVMRDLNLRAGEAVVRLLEQGSPGIIARFGIEADLVKILQHPTTSIACDCGSVVPGAASHPRYYGSFPRVLGRYVRDQKALSLEDGVRKMSGLPAATIGIVDRGLLAVGMAADVAIFDPNTIIDHATFEEPTLPSEGMRFVLVNGLVAVNDGVPTLGKFGKPLKRHDNMPTRPMSSDRETRVLKASIARERNGLALEVNVSQAPGERQARGVLRVSADTLVTPASAAAAVVETQLFGVVQTAGNWASVTGRIRIRSDAGEESFVLTRDGASLVIEFDGGGRTRLDLDRPR